MLRRLICAAAAGHGFSHQRGVGRVSRTHLHAFMTTPSGMKHEWDERASAMYRLREETGHVFETLFERSADAILLFDPQAGEFVDCNPAAVELMRAGTK